MIATKMAFGPNALSVPAGTLTHTATSSDSKFDSGAIRPSASFSFTLAEPGTYQYICSLHPEQMRARITVQ